MICPRCSRATLKRDANDWRRCPACGLRRRPDNRVVVRKDTGFYYLRTNTEMTPKGSETRIGRCGQFITSVHGVFDGDVHDTTFVLKRSDSDCCIAFSSDIEDLVIFAIEHDWWFSGPPKIVELAAILTGG